jgi:hypothetical protein
MKHNLRVKLRRERVHTFRPCSQNYVGQGIAEEGGGVEKKEEGNKKEKNKKN